MMSNVSELRSSQSPALPVHIALMVPRSEEGETLSAAFDALDAVGVSHKPLPAGELGAARRRVLVKRLGAAMEMLDMGQAAAAANVVAGVLRDLEDVGGVSP